VTDGKMTMCFYKVYLNFAKKANIRETQNLISRKLNRLKYLLILFYIRDVQMFKKSPC